MDKLSPAGRHAAYKEVLDRIKILTEDETNDVAVMATTACELHHAFEYFDWTGFYRTVAPEMLAVGPYQGEHGCLRIAFGRGVCGTAAAKKQTQLVDNVDTFPGHIACSSSTKSEVVVPIINQKGEVVAVLDIDSNRPAAFTQIDQFYLEQICKMIGLMF